MPTHPSDDACCPTSSPNPPGPTTTQRSQVPPPAVDVAKLRELLAHAAKTTPHSAPTPAMNFGQYVRQVVDVTPESTAGALAMGKFLRLDPWSKELDQVKAEVVTAKREISDLQTAQVDAPRSSKLSSPNTATKSRRGRKRREAGLDCTGQMLNVLIEDETAAVLTGRAWEERLRKRFGQENGFSRRTVEHTILFKDLRAAKEEAIGHYGPRFEEDVAAHGLEIWTYKPGRGDKRKDLSEKQSAAARKFLASVDFAKIQAKRLIESRCQAAGVGKGQ